MPRLGWQPPTYAFGQVVCRAQAHASRDRRCDHLVFARGLACPSRGCGGLTSPRGRRDDDDHLAPAAPPPRHEHRRRIQELVIKEETTKTRRTRNSTKLVLGKPRMVRGLRGFSCFRGFLFKGK